jgi:hypothetical protein
MVIDRLFWPRKKHLCYTLHTGLSIFWGKRDIVAIDALDDNALDTTSGSLIEQMDLLRLQVAAKIDSRHKKEFSQYFTPLPIARFMASLFTASGCLAAAARLGRRHLRQSSVPRH